MSDQRPHWNSISGAIVPDDPGEQVIKADAPFNLRIWDGPDTGFGTTLLPGPFDQWAPTGLQFDTLEKAWAAGSLLHHLVTEVECELEGTKSADFAVFDGGRFLTNCFEFETVSAELIRALISLKIAKQESREQELPPF